MSGAFTDEAAVLGEPVSQPHQAAVVGEPPPADEISPVLGEPVLLANGLSSDRPPVSSAPSLADGAAGVNGVGERSAVANEFRDVSLLSGRSNGEEPAAFEEARDEGTHPSAAERAGTGPESHETNTGAASAEVESTHLSDDPSQTSHPGSELPTDNPSSSLEAVLQEADVKSFEDAEGPSASNTASGDGDEVASAPKEEELAESSGQSASDLVLSEEKVSMKDDDDDDEAVPDSSLSHFSDHVSIDSVPVDSSSRRSVPIEESFGDKSCTDKTSLEEDGFQVSKNKPLAESEKSSHIKLPVIFTVVIAVVGVFAISISRSRQ